jgi:hypothetical protein
VVLEHPADGATFDGDATLDEGREKSVFLLEMVVGVGEFDKEVEALSDEIRGKWAVGGQAAFESGHHLFDEAVFGHKFVDGMKAGHEIS